MERGRLAELLGAVSGTRAPRVPGIVCEEDPTSFKRAFALAAAGPGQVFLADPGWGESEGAQLAEFTGPAEKLAGLRAISDQVAPGQWEYARSPTDKELAATTVLAMALDECSVKIRRGPPDDGDGPDGALDVWAGEIPLRTVRLDPRPDPALRPGIVVPDHLVRGRPAPGSATLDELGPT